MIRCLSPRAAVGPCYVCRERGVSVVVTRGREVGVHTKIQNGKSNGKYSVVGRVRATVRTEDVNRGCRVVVKDKVVYSV